MLLTTALHAEVCSKLKEPSLDLVDTVRIYVENVSAIAAC